MTPVERYCLAACIYTLTRSRCCVLWPPSGISSIVALSWLCYSSLNWNTVYWEKVNGAQKNLLILSCAGAPVASWNHDDSFIEGLKVAHAFRSARAFRSGWRMRCCRDICRETSGWFISPAWLPHWWPVCSGKTKLFLSRCGSQRWNVVFFSLKRIMSFPPSYSTSSSKNRTEIYGGMKWGSCTIGFFSITSNIDLGLVDGIKRYVSFFFPLLPP